jgi:hypothetical protein
MVVFDGPKATPGEPADACAVGLCGYDALVERISASGTRLIATPHFLAKDNVESSMRLLPEPLPASASAFDRAFGSLHVTVTPHVTEPARLRLQVEIDVAGKAASTTIEMGDKELTFLPTGITANGHHLQAAFQSTIVHTREELRSFLEERTRTSRLAAQRHAADAGEPKPSGSAP